MRLGELWLMTQYLMWETWKNLLASDFELAQSWPFGDHLGHESMDRTSLSISLTLHNSTY